MSEQRIKHVGGINQIICEATLTGGNLITFSLFSGNIWVHWRLWFWSCLLFSQKLFICGSKQPKVWAEHRSIIRQLQVSEDHTSTINLDHGPLINKSKGPSVCLGNVAVSPDRVVLMLKKMECPSRAPPPPPAEVWRRFLDFCGWIFHVVFSSLLFVLSYSDKSTKKRR